MTAMQETRHDERTAETAQLLDVLGRLIRTARAVGQRQQAEYGLSGTPFGILKSLAVADARAGDLAARLQIAPSVVSRALIPLEQAGLVERRHDPTDARAAQLGLTDAGRRQLASARREFADRFTPLLDDWTTDDVVTLTTLMDRLESTLLTGLDPRAAAHGSPTTS
jgi:DNA-binding MarR family transcriptional regulator